LQSIIFYLTNCLLLKGRSSKRRFSEMTAFDAVSRIPFFWLIFSIPNIQSASDQYTLINRVQTECELEALQVGSMLADRYNSFDEGTEWDTRIHNDYLTEHLGFANWIAQGMHRTGGKTAHGDKASDLYKKGGWQGIKRVNESSYWALEDQWLYMMGDSTQRQIWATFLSPSQNADFEKNAKNFTRDNCERQFPNRKAHASGGHFPEEGWHGKCGNNEVTCDFPGFGVNGRITFDWKHFAFEDYDEWLFGVYNNTGRWLLDKSDRRPDILTFEVGLHTCVHAVENGVANMTTIKRHEADIPKLMKAVKNAIQRHPTVSGGETMVIVSTAGRSYNREDEKDKCSWHYNRVLAHEAHKHGFVVLEREEIERRLLYKSEHYVEVRTMKPILHLENPAPNIIATTLLNLISCLRKNGTSTHSTLVDMGSPSLSKLPKVTV
jgi:hypothetical protein